MKKIGGPIFTRTKSASSIKTGDKKISAAKLIEKPKMRLIIINKTDIGLSIKSKPNLNLGENDITQTLRKIRYL